MKKRFGHVAFLDEKRLGHVAFLRSAAKWKKESTAVRLTHIAARVYTHCANHTHVRCSVKRNFTLPNPPKNKNPQHLSLFYNKKKNMLDHGAQRYFA